MTISSKFLSTFIDIGSCILVILFYKKLLMLAVYRNILRAYYVVYKSTHP